MHRDEEAKPFNEQAALAELERLQAAIQATRRKREQAVAEFDAFLRANRSGTGAGTARARIEDTARQDVPPIEPGQAATSAAVAGSASPLSAQAATPATTPALVAPKSAAASTPTPAERTIAFPVPGEEEEPPRGRAAVRWLAAAAAMVIAALGIAWWVGQSPTAPAAPVDTAPAVEQAAARTAEPPPRAAAPAVDPWAGLPDGVRVELATDRTVWLRVIVDDRRALEREVPAGERLRFAGDRHVLVRAGDAGGLRAIVGGVDQGVMGRDGIPVTRVFRPSDGPETSEAGTRKPAGDNR